VNIGGAIHQAKHQGLIEEGGGHAMAGGFSIKEENLAAFCQFINDFLREEVEQNPPFLLIEGALNATAVTVDLVRSLAALGPFGAGHAQPRFLIRNMRIAKIEILKQQHLRCLLLSEEQCFIKAMAFQCVNSELGEYLLSHQGRMMHFAGVLDLNIWNGKESVSFIIEDISL
jgi:single-stranded-DNA-specific exonuclease